MTTKTEQKTRKGIRFYHPDHLGSTTVVTDLDGEVTQNVAYIPYGEIFVEQRNGSWNTPYLFNAKELDEETGLYYYGARYLDPTGTRWLSVDPLFEKYVGMTPYGYCAGNPVKLVDVDGQEIYLSFDRSKKLRDTNLKQWKTNNGLYHDLGNLPDHEDIFFIGAHGNPNSIELQDGTRIKSAFDFEKYFFNTPEENLYKRNSMEGKQTVIVLYSCSTGKGDNSIGQQLSSDLGTLVFAPSEKVQVRSTSDIQVLDDGLFFDTGGSWNVFYKGELMEQINGYDNRCFFDMFGQDAVQLKDFLKGKTAEDLLKHYEKLYQEKHGKNEE